MDREKRREGLEKKQMQLTCVQTIFTVIAGASWFVTTYVSKSVETYLMEFIDGNDDEMISREEGAAGVLNGLIIGMVMTLITIAVIVRVFKISLTLP